ncbi:uncharacterized protein EDB93DRAFT_1108290 [Suillus bovinus]|uniref:uncharacterized protein n=1 Tax=Suillus bovinus TaxID=48563 RepID=UPI001B86330D|nr:uncharacterized protein EDB93DRAFT_1108290 [Suillus bovinus]KAG2130769.1 hypothetical protein EDB93DRAFT_1108290 [Suillus bovinus]
MSLQIYTTYDFACLLQEEWTFLLQSRWTKVKGLYIASRFVPFLLLIGHLYTNFIPSDNPGKCKILITICSVFSQIAAVCSECFFVLRTYALWRHNRFVLAGLLAFFFSWRMANGRLYAILVKSNIAYYTCGLFLSAVNVLASRSLHCIVCAILALRMHLHIWQIDQQAHNIDALVCSTWRRLARLSMNQ